MFENNIFTNYDMGNATGEILIMLIGAFLLGYLLRWVQNKVWGCGECFEVALDQDTQRVEYVEENIEIDVEESSSTMPIGVKENDLKIVEGIGPKIEQLLHNANIQSWAELAETSNARLQEILTDAGDRFNMHDPSTWSKQAQLAHEGKWSELTEYQDTLNNGS